MRYATLATRLALAALLLSSVAACVPLPPPGETAVWVRIGPPEPRREVIVEQPGPEYFWIAGYYRWDGGVYAWVPGRWERRPRERAVWVSGRWYHERRGWYWVEGHWRS